MNTGIRLANSKKYWFRMDWDRSILLHRREITRVVSESLGESGILPHGDLANEWDGW